MSVPSGSIYLVKNALVDRSYSHTIDFKNSSEQLAYWSSLIKYTLTEYSYIRRSSQLIKVEKNLDELQDVNYLFYRAKEDSKLYYCFVTNKEYISDTVTAVYFEVDVLQTRMFEYQVKESYVLQEHCDRWDANLKPIYSRTDEGLEYGSEYTIEAGYKIKPDIEDTHLIRWFLAICKPHGSIASEGFNTSTPDNIGLTNPYVFFLLPELSGNRGSVKFSYKGGYTDATLTETIHNLSSFSAKMAESELGVYLHQIVKLPYPPFDFKYGETTDANNVVWYYVDATGIENIEFTSTKIGEGNYLRMHTSLGATINLMKTLAEMSWDEGIKDALPTAEQWEDVKKNPYTTERDKRFESKLLTHPYRYNILSDWKSMPVVIKNEYLCNDKIKVNHTQAISFNSPARYWLEGYKKDPEGRGSSLIQLVPEEAPIITDAYYTYMLENKNQLQADRTNATMSALTSTGTAIAGGIISGGMTAGLPGAILGAAIGGLTSIAQGTTNTANLVRSQNAKQKDLKNLPDTIINPNDVNFSYFDGNEWVSFYRYKITCEFENLLADTFAMSGYTVKRVKVPNLKTRVRYNYIKTVGANIVGSFDQNDLTMLKAIFDNGVTFWHYNTVNFKPLDYSLENIETKLL